MIRRCLLVLTWLVVAGVAHADRRYFVDSYTPYLASAGTLEFEVTTAAAIGQGDTSGAAWRNRIEFEYGLSNHVTGAMYLNFVQPAGLDAPLSFDGPSLEVIYRFAEPGRWAVDPGVYLEVRESGSEFELEPKLLLARRIYQLVRVVNVIGEYEAVHAGPDRGAVEKQLRLTAGVSREVGHVGAFGLEMVYTHTYLDEAEDASSLQLGPTFNLQTAKIQWALGWQPQLSGRPASNGRLNLSEFPRSEVRLIVGVDL